MPAAAARHVLPSDGRVRALFEKALADAWNVADDLPWDRAVDLASVDLSERESLVAKLPAYATLDEGQRAALRLRELTWNLSNLLEGEWRGGVLGARVVVDSAPESREVAAFIATVTSDEVKHHHVLERYLREHAGPLPPPHPGLERIFADLMSHEVWELKLLVGQVVFEETATTTMHSLLVRGREPLLAAILRRLLRDEARHLAFSHIVTGTIARRYPARTVRSVEDVLFEAVCGCVATFAAEPVWEEMGFPRADCRRAAVEELAQRGVLELYTRVLPRSLAQRGFPSDRLAKLLGDGLVHHLLEGSST